MNSLSFAIDLYSDGAMISLHLSGAPNHLPCRKSAGIEDHESLYFPNINQKQPD